MINPMNNAADGDTFAGMARALERQSVPASVEWAKRAVGTVCSIQNAPVISQSLDEEPERWDGMS